MTAEHLQKFFDSLSTPQHLSNGNSQKDCQQGSLNVYAAVMRGAFRFAVFQKQLITFNPMQYVVIRGNKDEIFSEEKTEHSTDTSVITHEQFLQMTDYLRNRNILSLLAFQIGYYTGLRIGEICGLTWQNIDLENQYLTVRRSMNYNNVRKCAIIGPTKRKKIRTVDFTSTLAEILRNAKKQQEQNRLTYGELYYQNYYTIGKSKNRTYYDVHCLPVTEKVSEEFSRAVFGLGSPQRSIYVPKIN